MSTFCTIHNVAIPFVDDAPPYTGHPIRHMPRSWLAGGLVWCEIYFPDQVSLGSSCSAWCKCSRQTRLIDKQVLATFTLWLFNIAMENGPFIDGLPIKNGDFP